MNKHPDYESQATFSMQVSVLPNITSSKLDFEFYFWLGESAHGPQGQGHSGEPNWSLSLRFHALGASKEQSGGGGSPSPWCYKGLQIPPSFLPKPYTDAYCVPDSMFTLSTRGLSGRLED